jgi:hypothetical protein
LLWRDWLAFQREYFYMGKSGFVVAVIAATCSSMAFAGEVKQDKKAPVPSVKTTTMSNADMDKVTAGGPSTDNNGGINGGGMGLSGNQKGLGWERNNGNGRF